MSRRVLDRVIALLVLVNVLALVGFAVWPTSAASPGTAGRPGGVSGNGGPGGVPAAGRPGGAPGEVPAGSASAATLNDVTMTEIYFALPRLAERPATRYDEAQAKRLAEELSGAEDRTRLLALLNASQKDELVAWHRRAAGWPEVGRRAMYATRADALAFFKSPMPPPLPDMGSDGPGQPRLAVPYYDLLWLVMVLDQESKLPVDAKQAKFIADVVAELLEVFSHLQTMYTSAVHVAENTLRPEQLAYIRSHPVRIEEYSKQFADLLPKDADVVGYLALRTMARRAGASVSDVPAAQILDLAVDPSPSADRKPDPEIYFAGALVLDQVEELALDRDQCLALIPYVKGVADENYHSHMVKEQISDVLTRDQRVWMLEYMQKNGRPRVMPGPGDVIRQMRGHLAETGR